METTPSMEATGTSAVTTTETPGVPVTGANCDTITVQLASNATGTSTGTTTGTTGTGTAAVGTPVGTATVTGTDMTGTPPTGTQTGTSSDYLVDCKGMSLYVTKDDTPNSGSSTCTGDCAKTWLPLTVAEGATPKAGDGVDDSLLSTITRDDGTLQVTYNGWPLYTYTGDTAAGDKNGVGMDNKWFLISAAGDPIEQ
ncbi:MAG: hypothetical protein ACM3QS_14520 [Bacteroidota bacterium]